MLNQCKGCYYHAKDNNKIREGGTKTIIGDYCLRFRWNLGIAKTWLDKQTDVKSNKYPPMKLVPKTCRTGGPVK